MPILEYYDNQKEESQEKGRIRSSKHGPLMLEESHTKSFWHDDDKEALSWMKSDIASFTSRYGFDRFIHLFGGNRFELCFNIPNPPMGLSPDQQCQFMELAMQSIRNIFYREYGGNGEYLPGLFMLPRFGIMDGIKNQWNVSVALSRWMLPQRDRAFASSLTHERGPDPILKSIRSLVHYIEDDTEKLIARIRPLWASCCSSVLLRNDFDETAPLVSAGFPGNYEGQYHGVYVADPYADAYDIVYGYGVCSGSKSEVIDGEETIKHEKYFYRAHICKPGHNGQNDRYIDINSKEYENRYFFHPRKPPPFCWKAYGWMKEPCFRKLMVSASWVGLKEPMREFMNREPMDQDYESFLFLNRPLPEIVKRAAEFRTIYDSGNEKAVKDHLSEYVHLRPVLKDDGRFCTDEQWLLKYFNWSFGVDMYPSTMETWRELFKKMVYWDNLAEADELLGSEMDNFDIDEAHEYLEMLEGKLHRRINGANECIINSTVNDAKGIYPPLCYNRAERRPPRFFYDLPLIVNGVGIPVMLSEI